MPLEVFITALLAYAIAAALELRDGRIRNSLCAAVAAIGLYRWVGGALLHPAPDAWAQAGWAVGVAVLVFVLGTLAFRRGWIGGGAVKLMAASVLLVGASDAPGFVMLMMLMGAVLSIFLLTLARFGWLPGGAAPAPRGARAAFRIRVSLHYGLAIALAAAILLVLQFRRG